MPSEDLRKQSQSPYDCPNFDTTHLTFVIARYKYKYKIINKSNPLGEKRNDFNSIFIKETCH